MEWNLIDALDAWLWIAFRGIDHAGSNIGKINYGLNRPTSAHQHIIFYKLKTKKSVKICENISRIHEYLLLYIFRVTYLFVDIFKWIYIMQASPRSPALGVLKWPHKRGDCSLALLCWELWRSLAAICWRGMGCIGFENTQVFLYTPCTEWREANILQYP